MSQAANNLGHVALADACARRRRCRRWVCKKLWNATRIDSFCFAAANIIAFHKQTFLVEQFPTP
jgi:hypothetical protein